MKMKPILISSSIIILFDQIIKFFVRKYLLFEIDKIIIPNFFYLTFSKNTGGAFSIFENNSIILALIGLLFLVGIVFYIYKLEKITFFEKILYGILIGGIIGNIIDRIIFGYVTDYIGLIFGNYYYPVFNLADIGIVISIICFLIIEFRSGKNGSKGN